MKEDMTINTEKIQRIIRSYYENLYSTKLESVKEMSNFLDRYYITTLNQDQEEREREQERERDRETERQRRKSQGDAMEKPEEKDASWQLATCLRPQAS